MKEAHEAFRSGAQASSLGRRREDFNFSLNGARVNLLEAVVDGSFRLSWLTRIVPERLPRFPEFYTLAKTALLTCLSQPFLRKAASEAVAKHNGASWLFPVKWIEKKRKQNRRLVPALLLREELGKKGVRMNLRKWVRLLRDPKAFFGEEVLWGWLGGKESLLEPSPFGHRRPGKENFLVLDIITAWHLAELLIKAYERRKWDTIKILAGKVGVSRDEIDGYVRKGVIHAEPAQALVENRLVRRISPEEVARVERAYQRALGVHLPLIRPYTDTSQIKTWRDLRRIVDKWDNTRSLRRKWRLNSDKALYYLVTSGKLKAIPITNPFSNEPDLHYPPGEVQDFEAREERRFLEIAAFVERHSGKKVRTRAKLKGAIRGWTKIEVLARLSGRTPEAIRHHHIRKGKLEAVKLDLLGMDRKLKGYWVPPEAARRWLAEFPRKGAVAAGAESSGSSLGAMSAGNRIRRISVARYGNSLEAVLVIWDATGKIIGLDLKRYFPEIHRQLLVELQKPAVSGWHAEFEAELGDLLNFLGAENHALVVTGETAPEALLAQIVCGTTAVIHYQNEKYLGEVQSVARQMIRKGILTEDELKRRGYFIHLPSSGLTVEEFLARLLKGKSVPFGQGRRSLDWLKHMSRSRQAVWMAEERVIDRVTQQVIEKALPLEIQDLAHKTKEGRAFIDIVRLGLAVKLAEDPKALERQGYVIQVGGRYEITPHFIESFLQNAFIQKQVQKLLAQMV